ncbi:MAG: hypothetical protein AAB538_00630, partial [Patescibacteria group bacterium]
CSTRRPARPLFIAYNASLVEFRCVLLTLLAQPGTFTKAVKATRRRDNVGKSASQLPNSIF